MTPASRDSERTVPRYVASGSTENLKKSVISTNCATPSSSACTFSFSLFSPMARGSQPDGLTACVVLEVAPQPAPAHTGVSQTNATASEVL